MTSHTIDTPTDDDFDARARRISGKILDGIEETLAEMTQPPALRAAIERAVQTHRATLLCRQALCRRAQRCRRQPCAVPAPDYRTS